MKKGKQTIIFLNIKLYFLTVEHLEYKLFLFLKQTLNLQIRENHVIILMIYKL